MDAFAEEEFSQTSERVEREILSGNDRFCIFLKNVNPISMRHPPAGYETRYREIARQVLSEEPKRERLR